MASRTCPSSTSSTIKDGLGLMDHRVILSFGLLGPGKGYELAIDALPAVIADHPDVLYVIVGATHPDLLRREGEAYRTALMARAEALGVADHVRFVDRFVGRVELTRWLEAADVFVTPYPNLDQIVSGTLSYAMGAGRAIVSTPYTYARELLADGRGVLVEAGLSGPASRRRSTRVLRRRRSWRAELGRRAYAHARRMIWSEVGGQYGRLFDRVAGGVPSVVVPSTVPTRRVAVHV